MALLQITVGLQVFQYKGGSMNIFKQITFVKRVKSALKQAKQTIDNNQGLASSVKNRVEYLKDDLEELLKLLPQLKPVFREGLEIVEKIF